MLPVITVGYSSLDMSLSYAHYTLTFVNLVYSVCKHFVFVSVVM
jgi:hypothetical protein